MPETCCEKFGVATRLLLLGLCGAGIALQVLAGLECNFITYKDALDFGVGNGDGATANSSSSGETGSIGMLEQRPIGTDECVPYAYTASGTYVATARTALVVGLAGAVAATALVLFEVLLVRVCCSRLLEGLAFNLAIVATGVVYAIFASPYCNAPFGCTWGTGAIYNVVAGGCYLLALMLMCFTPKPKPLLRKLCCPGKDEGDDGGSRRKDDGVADSLDELESAQPENDYEPYDPNKPFDPAVYADTSPSSGTPHYASPY